jgi:hypothetical protein
MEPLMGEDPGGSSKQFDPLEPFRDMRDAYLDAMAKVMVEAVNTEAYARATGTMLDSSLAVSAPFKEAMEKSMLQMLQQLSLPSAQDFATLADRFTNLELRLDDMDAKLDRIDKRIHAAPAVAPREPAMPSETELKAAVKKRAGARKAGAPKRSVKKAQPHQRNPGKETRK